MRASLEAKRAATPERFAGAEVDDEQARRFRMDLEEVLATGEAARNEA
jgi:hypothetical protein